MKMSFLLMIVLSVMTFYGINENSETLKEKFSFNGKKPIALSKPEQPINFNNTELILLNNRPAVICIKIDDCFYCKTTSKVI